MKYIIILLLAMCLGACSSTPKTAHITMPELGEGESIGWIKNKNNMTFNTGKLDWNFHSSPIGKVYNYFFGKREIDLDDPNIPVVQMIGSTKGDK